MKWRFSCATLVVVLLVMAIMTPVALAQDPQPKAARPAAGQNQQPTPERRFIDTLRRANRMRGSVRGKITALGTNEIEVTIGQEENAEVRILSVDDETQYRVPEIEEPSFADLQVDDLVTIMPTAENPDLAKMVGVVTPRQMRAINAGQRLLQGVNKLLGHNARRGEVTAISAASVTVTTPQGDVELILSDNTRFLDADGEEIGLDDLAVGDAITVVGRPDPTAPINAGVIKIMPEPSE